MKDFDQWNRQKKNIHNMHHSPMFKERDIWWCAIGINIGHEQDGKGDLFNRPVLVIKKFNKQLFWGVPLTTKIKDNPHYHAFELHSRRQCAMLTHLRLYDSHRLSDRMGRLPTDQFKIICDKLIAYIK